MTLQDWVKDADNAVCSGPSWRSDFLQSTGNSTNNSEATTRQHTLREKVLRGIHPINKNYTLENTLLDTQAKMASIVAQNKLLQEQLDVLNQGQGEPWILSEKIAWDVKKRSAKALPFAAGEWHGSNILDPEEANEPMVDGDLPMPIRGGGDRDAAGGWFNKEYIHYVDDLVPARGSARGVASARDLVQGRQDMQATTAHTYSSGYAPLHPGQEAGQATSASCPPHVNHCGICPLLGLPQGTNISPGAWCLSRQSDFTHSIGNSTMNNAGTAQGLARRKEALKSLSLINQNCKLTEELVKERDWFATEAEEYRLLENCLQQYELRNAQPPALLTNDTVMVVKETRGAGKVSCSSDADENKMVVVLRGGG
jgi:hypothetical protein